MRWCSDVLERIGGIGGVGIVHLERMVVLVAWALFIWRDLVVGLGGGHHIDWFFCFCF